MIIFKHNLSFIMIVILLLQARTVSAYPYCNFYVKNEASAFKITYSSSLEDSRCVKHKPVTLPFGQNTMITVPLPDNTDDYSFKGKMHFKRADAGDAGSVTLDYKLTKTGKRCELTILDPGKGDPSYSTQTESLNNYILQVDMSIDRDSNIIIHNFTPNINQPNKCDNYQVSEEKTNAEQEEEESHHLLEIPGSMGQQSESDKSCVINIPADSNIKESAEEIIDELVRRDTREKPKKIFSQFLTAYQTFIELNYPDLKKNCYYGCAVSLVLIVVCFFTMCALKWSGQNGFPWE